eukprot:TRINITY_DN19921_c0_g1_i1.p1 TRINITY_DN19921_c0_g1~~TRINITY_DN19921_c0_g1_i1.p1  ORF type:complete len:514 (+),score=52.13 TRINITY_DN19921_c0_g1_i1:64-1542(+)
MPFRFKILYLSWSAWLFVPLLGNMATTVHNCCTNLTLRFGMPPASFDPYFIYSGVPSTQDLQAEPPSYGGYVPALVDMLSEEMGFKALWVTHAWLPMQQSFDMLLSGTLIDVALISLSGHENTSFVLSTPMISGHFGAMTYVKTRATDMFIVFAPFSTDLWVAVVCSIFVLALCLILLRLISVKSRQETLLELRPRQLLRAVYHSLAAVLGGEDYEFTRGSGRILRIAMLFFVMIMGATYTANLAAYFTQSKREVLGPSDMAELSEATVCIVLQDFGPWIQPFVKEVVLVPFDSLDSSVTTETRREWCKVELAAGRVDAIVDSYNILLKYNMQNCDDTFLVPSIKFAPFFSAFMMPNTPQNFDVVTKLTAGIIQLQQRPSYQQMRTETLQEGKACEEPEASDTEAVSSESMKGMFLICIAGGILAVLVALVERCADRQKAKSGVEEDSEELAMTDGEMLKQLMADMKELKTSVDISMRSAAKASCSGELANV